jgi:hypothetical protein
MDLEGIARLLEAIAKLVAAVAWPLVAVAALISLGPSVAKFLFNLSEVRLRGRGFEASAIRRLDLDATSQKLYEFWKPGGRTDRGNAARIAAAMRELGMVGSVAWLMNAGTSEDRARVAAHLSIDQTRQN